MYIHYFRHRRSIHLKVNPKKSYKELQSIIQNEWDQMPQEEKQYWMQKVLEEKANDQKEDSVSN